MTPRLLFVLGSVLALPGAVLFVVAILTHSHVLWTIGLSLMAGAAVVSIVFYVRNANGRSRLLTRASVTWALFFVVWLVIWTGHRPPIWAVVATFLFALGAFVLAYAWWQSERRSNRSTRGG